MIVTAAVILDFEGNMLLGRRKDTKLYGPPGGKLDNGEHLRVGCVRELWEETGMKAEPHDLVELGFCERLDKNQIIFWYWVSLYRMSPINMEPDKCYGWAMMRIPPDELCIPGLRLFKAKLLSVLNNVANIKVAA